MVAIALVRCSSRVKSANNAVTTAESVSKGKKEPNEEQQVLIEEKLTEPEFDSDGQMSLIAEIQKREIFETLEKDKPKEETPEPEPNEIDSNDINVPSYKRNKNTPIL